MKIHSLWKRQGWYFDQDKKKLRDYQKDRHSFILDEYACPEFGNIKRWHVEEKVDGTNIRIIYRDGKVSFGGRTSAAQLPCHLLQYLQDNFYHDLLHKVFPPENETSGYPPVILYGEGYGVKIQGCGGNYRSDVGFILFDVLVGKWWLKREDVRELASKLNVPMCPFIGLMKEEDIIDYVKSKPKSLCSEHEQVMEGVVCRSEPLMLFRDGSPILWKLKCKEF